MMEGIPAMPRVLLALDLLGTVLLALGVLALTGVNFGQPVLTSVAPGLIVLGVLLYVPFIAWIVRAARSRQ